MTVTYITFSSCLKLWKGKSLSAEIQVLRCRSLKRCEVATIFQGLSGAVLAVLLVALLGLILLGSSSDDGEASPAS